MLCKIYTARIQPRKRVPDHADYIVYGSHPATLASRSYRSVVYLSALKDLDQHPVGIYHTDHTDHDPCEVRASGQTAPREENRDGKQRASGAITDTAI